ncbi:MAG: hypothetical protein HRT66_10010 [Flavobacteriaceae bacterium]|nr:hypothetical protein [Flavobacteriaceae bacterium]
MLLKTNLNYKKINIYKEELEFDMKLSLSKYFENSNYTSDIIDEILDKEFISSNPSYYLYYPYLFNEYFDIHDKKTLDLISISGFLYYKSVILIDDIFDNKDSKNNFNKFFIANICQEETVKIISSFFKIDSSFWDTWNIRKFEYAKAYKMDKTMKNIKSYDEFEKLADYKSAFGKIGIDCLFHLSTNKDKAVYNDVLNSHKLFYTSFQITDDIADYMEDVENDQFNISKHELIKVLGDENIDNYSIKEQNKLMYFKGIASELYSKAIAYTDKAISIMNLGNYSKETLWKNELYSLHNTCISNFLNITGFVETYKVKNKLSNKIQVNNNLKDSIDRSIKYIIDSQDKQGSWNDIFNEAGVSNVWATSYIGYLLSESNVNISNKLLKKASNYLIQNKNSDALWGYNNMWIDDADSSSFALLNIKSDVNINIYFNNWLKFQKKDGGFSTYKDENILLSSLNSSKIKNVKGWTQSHFCVSSVSYLVFVELELTNSDSFKFLRSYLISKLKSYSNIISYWWAGEIYAIHYILLGAVKNKDTELVSICEIIVNKLVKKNEVNYFFKGLMLHTLCLTDNLFIKHNSKVIEIAEQIINKQYTDGSWEEGFSLKIPHPSVIDVNNKDIAWTKDSKGTNIMVSDYNRLFTTASCLTALKKYEERRQQYNN